MPYIGLGYRRIVATPDRTGNNPGNWTVVADASALAVNVPYFEVYRITVDKAAPQATFAIYVDQAEFEIPQRGDANSWDPNLPLLVIPGEAIFFYYSTAATDGMPPQVTLFLRYDPSIVANANTSLGQGQ